MRKQNHPLGVSKSPTQSLLFEKLEARQLLAADFVSSPGFAAQQLWQPLPAEAVSQPGDRIHVQASEALLFDIHETLLLRALSHAPLEFTAAAAEPLRMVLPHPSGEFQRFEIVESPIISDELAQRFPGIKTYRGIGIDDPGSTLRMDVTSHGFHAQVLSSQGTWLVDPYFHLETEIYAAYESHAAMPQLANQSYRELAVLDLHDHDHEQEHEHEHKDQGKVAEQRTRPEQGLAQARNAFGGGLDLRVFDTAVAATGEYTQFHGGTVASALTEIVVAMNRVNQIYERDIAARMVLVGNNDQVIYTDGASDPYTNENGFAMLGENQANLDAVIGDANYDLGHVFSTGGGGVAGLGVIGISGQKARGVTGLPSPIGDPFYVDYVAHEIGHQYGGNHTFNGDSGSCAGGNRNGSTAYEPGSGVTIQAYAGICGNDDLQPNSDDMFHSQSILEMRSTITSGAGNAAATIITTTNQQPQVNAGQNYTIPSRTPFSLTAIGSDPDPADVLTYSWEQRDLGPQQDVNAGDNGSSPLFRTWLPTTDPTRVFPRLSDLLNNTTVVGETLPTTNRNLNFLAVVRDNSLEPAGGVAFDNMRVTVIDAGVPFEITSQNTPTTWTGTQTENITWTVAATDVAPINATTVDILFSTDGGQTFDSVLASGVDNDGSHDVVVPNIPTSNGRIRIQPVDNIFFDINNVDIEVLEGGPSVNILQSGGVTNIAEGGSGDTYQLALATQPLGQVDITIRADWHSEISTDGVVYGSSIVLSKTDTLPSTVFVRAVDDGLIEGEHISRVSHRISSSSDPLYNASLPIRNVVADVQDNDNALGEFLVGVDFGPSNGLSPLNWTPVGASASTLTLSDLIFEDGTPSPYDLTIEELSDGSWNTDDPTINLSTVPQHPNPLVNLDGQIWTGGDPLQVTWSELDSSLDYEVYVFGLEGFYADISQQLTIQGGDAPLVVVQNFDQRDLFINNQLGSDQSDLRPFAFVVTPNSSGQIIINVDPLPGGNDVVLGGVAIAEKSPATQIAALADKRLDGVVAGGGLADTGISNNTYYELNPSLTNNPQKQIVELILLSESNVSNPDRFDFVLEARMQGGPQGDVIQQVDLWDDQNKVWETVDLRSVTGNDGRVQIPTSGDLSRFVHPLTNEVLAKVSWISPEFFEPAFDWSIDIDQIAWLIQE